MKNKQMLIIISILIASTLLACGPKPTDDQQSERVIPRSEQITVGVLYFDANSNKPEVKAAAGGFTDMFIADLSKFPRLRVIERTKLENTIDEMGLRETLAGGIDDATAQRIGKMLGAQTLFYGGITEILGKIKLSGRLVRVETTEILVAENSKTHNVEDALELVTEVSKKIDADIARKYELLLADNFYSQGWHAEEDGYIDKAIEWYKKAIALYPNHKEAKKALSQLQ